MMKRERDTQIQINEWVRKGEKQRKRERERERET